MSDYALQNDKAEKRKSQSNISKRRKKQRVESDQRQTPAPAPPGNRKWMETDRETGGGYPVSRNETFLTVLHCHFCGKPGATERLMIKRYETAPLMTVAHPDCVP